MKNIYLIRKFLLSLAALLLLTFLLLPATASFAEEEKQANYCKDPTTWSDWEELLQKYPGDQDVRMLYALRMGLCVLVERKELTVDEATRIFEEQRTAATRRMKMEDGRRRKLEI